MKSNKYMRSPRKSTIRQTAPLAADTITEGLWENGGVLFIRLGAISNCQLPITLEVIANDPITNYFTKKVMGNAPNYQLLFGYISN